MTVGRIYPKSEINLYDVLFMHLNVHAAERFHEMKQCPGTYFVVVIEDIEKSQVVGAATLIVEQKFIHNAASVSCICSLYMYFALKCFVVYFVSASVTVHCSYLVAVNE